MEVIVGSMVILASGGPKMTVVDILEGKASCKWFNRSSDQMHEVYPVECLVVAKDEKPA